MSLIKLFLVDFKSLPPSDLFAPKIRYNVVVGQKCRQPHFYFWEEEIMKKNEETIVSCGGLDMPNNDTELVFILDRSGSMAGFEDDTIGGFNAMIEKQKSEGEGMVYVSTVLFDNESDVLHDRVPIGEIKPMTRGDYRVRGCTALLDAIGGAIHHIGNVHKYARPSDVPRHTIFVITTDGMENASRNYSYSDIKSKIKRQTEKYGWEFVFLAANIDAAAMADDIGIRRDRAAKYCQTSEGVGRSYFAMSEAITRVRCDCAETIDLAKSLETENGEK